jgi:hypothetical protein
LANAEPGAVADDLISLVLAALVGEALRVVTDRIVLVGDFDRQIVAASGVVKSLPLRTMDKGANDSAGIVGAVNETLGTNTLAEGTVMLGALGSFFGSVCQPIAASISGIATGAGRDVARLLRLLFWLL